MSTENYKNVINDYSRTKEDAIDFEVATRLKNNTKTYSYEEVRGNKAKKIKIVIDNNDGWE